MRRRGDRRLRRFCLVDPNTRQGKRTPVTLKIKFKSETLEQFIERYAVDVSQGGIFIRTKEPLAVGTQMKFEFQLRDASPLIAGEGTVVWTRENDPSRPAIAPGMGVRFDRLAEGSQGILERILTEKAKQAPQRPTSDTSKPPLFTDTPTRVAPAPVQEALLGKDGRSRRTSDEPTTDSHTPLPRPIPFHSDADEFPDEAFEEATKVRALDELIAQTAEGGGNPLAALSASTNGAAADEAVRKKDEATAALERAETQEAPGLPSPPEAASRPLPKLLDASPSPRVEGAQPAFVSESLARTRLGVEPARPRSLTPGPNPGPGPGPSEAPPLPGVRAVAAETTEPARMPPAQSKSIAPIAVLILLLIAAVGAAVWFLVIRPKAVEHTDPTPTTAQGSADTAGSATPTAGSAAPIAGSAAPTAGSAAAPPATDNAPKGELVDTVVASSEPNTTVTIEGTDQSGPAPFTAKLEKGKAYKAKLSAKGFTALALDVKGGDGKQVGKLVAKPRVIQVTSDPEGALLWVDNSSTGHTTPFSIELTPAQAAKKAVHVQIRKSGYKTIDRVVDLSKLTEDDTQLSTKLDEKLAQVAAAAPAGGGTPAGGGQPAGEPVTHPGGGTKPAGGDAGSAATPDSTPPAGGDKPAGDKPAGDKPAEKPAEPEPEFKPQP
ncbi:MAG TPA: TIGR02266 family protein [Kofleriaceae bacterium]|nr:TIGR02266 family protein [Kofleriaceae bacterium]